MDKKCKDCPNFAKFANTDECGIGMCMATYVEVICEGKCAYALEPHTCADCQHYVENDTACMTAKANDPAEDCCGFVDVKYGQMVEILTDWLLRGKDCIEEFKAALAEAQDFVNKINA